MLMETLSILAIAVASGKAGYVYLSDGTLQDWGITVKAAKTCSDLVGFAQGLINDLRPDVVVESPQFYRRPIASFHATISSTSCCA
jgi:hypothetical protein